MSILALCGATGWIGSTITRMMVAEEEEEEEEEEEGPSSSSRSVVARHGQTLRVSDGFGFKSLYVVKARLEDRDGLLQELKQANADAVLNCAGVTGRPNVDWCEDHKVETLRANVLGHLNLADVCHELGIHCTMMATGCIYEYDEGKHKMHSGHGFVEEDPPNYAGSFYSKTKAQVESMLACYPQMLILRLRMPISSEYEHPRNFITKITHYKRVVNIPNSVSILEDLLPIAIDMVETKRTGIYNFTNPGTLSHNQVLELYQKYIHPDFQFENFTLEEQAKILKAGRSNNELNVGKLLALYPDLKPAAESIHDVFRRMKESMPQDAKTPIPSR